MLNCGGSTECDKLEKGIGASPIMRLVRFSSAWQRIPPPVRGPRAHGELHRSSCAWPLRASTRVCRAAQYAKHHTHPPLEGCAPEAECCNAVAGPDSRNRPSVRDDGE